MRHSASATSTAPRRTPASPRRCALLIADGRIVARHPAAERARAHRRARRLPHHRHPGVRRAARRAGTPRPGRARAPSPGCPAAARAPTTGRCSRAPATATRSTSTARPPPRRPGVAAAYADAVAELPALPRRRTATSPPACRAPGGRSPRRTTPAGCPPTPSRSWSRRAPCRAAAIVARALTGRRRPGAGGDRRSTPTPPRRSGTAAPGSPAAPVDPDGWDLDAVAATLRQAAPRLAYLIPDFQNPTGHADDRRAARGVRRPPAADPHRRGRRRGAPGAGARRAGDAAPVRGVRPRHDHHRQRQQAVLGRPAAGLAAGAARADGRAHPGPARPRPRARRCWSSWC